MIIGLKSCCVIVRYFLQLQCFQEVGMPVAESKNGFGLVGHSFFFFFCFN